MAFSQDEGEDLYQQVPNSASVQTMTHTEVTSWINRLIGSFGGCITEDSKRKLLQIYLQKQKDIASIQPPPMSSTVDNMPFEEVSTLLLNQIGTFAECSDEQSQRNLLKTYLRNKELKGQGKLSDYTPLRSSDPLDYEVEFGSYVLDEGLKTGRGELMDCTHQKSKDLYEDEVEYGSDVLDAFSKMTHHVDHFRPEGKCLDGMDLIKVGFMLDILGMETTNVLEKDILRLKQLLFSGQENDSSMQQMKNIVNTTIQKYNDVKEKLVECYSELTDIVQNESFKKEMSNVTELRFPQYEEKLCSNKTMLQDMTSEFDIVIVGETSAGKSTFLNVLLGENILPKAHSHTTAALCRLHNSEKKMIKYETENITLEDSSKLKETLEAINQQLKRTDEETLKTIDIYWPISSFHENVVLVDTPGIGETDALTNQVAECVPNSAGYIFIVDSSHAGGVRDYGIKKLIQAVADLELTKEQTEGLNNVLFVCNKWDKVPKGERKTVMEDTKAKLSKCCRHLEEWQIVEFNAELELQLLEWKANPTMNIKVLFQSLQTLMIRTIEKRLGDKYRWLNTFVNEVLGFLNARINLESESKERIQAVIQATKTLLDDATSQVKQIGNVESMIDDEEEKLLQDLRTYLLNVVQSEKLEEKGILHVKARLLDTILEWSDNGQLHAASARIREACKNIKDNIDSIFRSIDKHELGFNLQHNTEKLAFAHKLAYFNFGLSLVNTFFCTLSAIGSPRHFVPFAAVSYILVCMTVRQLRQARIFSGSLILNTLSEDRVREIVTALFSRPHRNGLAQWQKETQCSISSICTTLETVVQNQQINSGILCMLESLQTTFTKYSKCLELLRN